MIYDIHSIFANSQVASVVSQTGTTVVVGLTSGDGALFSINQQVIMSAAGVIPKITNSMIGRVTGINTDQITIDISGSSLEGSSIRTVIVGDTIFNGSTPKIFTDLETNKIETSLIGAASGLAQLDSGSVIPAVQMRMFNFRGQVIANTTYNRYDIVSYRGKRILITGTVTSNSSNPPFISAASYIAFSGDALIYASDFGVKSDSATDDAAAVNAAIAYCSALGGGTVMLPEGITAVGSVITLQDRVWLRGVSKSDIGSTIKLLPNANCHVVQTYVSTGSGNPNAEFCGIIDISLDGNYTNQAGAGPYYGISFNTNPTTSQQTGDHYFDMNHVVQNVRIYRAKGDGVHMAGRSAIQLYSVLTEQCQGYGFFTTFDTNLVMCEASNSGLDGFYFNNGSIRLSACKAYLSGQVTSGSAGFRCDSNSTNVSFSSCEAQNNSGQGFYINAANRISLAACVADSNNIANGGYAGIELNNAAYCLISLVCSQGKQGGVQIGNQNNAIKVAGGSANNFINVTHSAFGGASVGSAVAGGSTLTGNMVIVNGVSQTDLLSLMNDVTVTSPSDLQVLTYNAATSKWINSNAGNGVFAEGIFGDGSDGTVHFDGSLTFGFASKSGSTYTLTKDVYSTSLTIDNTVTVITAGFRLFSTGAVTNNGSILCNGNDGQANGTAGATTGNNTLAGGVAGGAGNTGNGSAGSNATSSCVGTGNGAAGGAGSGGSGGAAANAANTNTFMLRTPQIVATGTISFAASAKQLGGGPSGGGGAGDATNKGGGGGSGGGCVAISAHSVTNGATGVIQAKGGNGGSPATGNCGGGGGGGGGLILIFTLTGWTNSGATSVVGGTGGTAVGTGSNGSNGTAGNVLNVVLQ